MKKIESGSEGWDAYAPFYDWENAQTVARRDIAFWQRLAVAHAGNAGNDGPVLEPERSWSGLTCPPPCWRARAGGWFVPA